MTLATLMAMLAAGAGVQVPAGGAVWTPYGVDQQAEYEYRLVEGNDATSARAVIRATPVRQRRYAFAEMDYRFDCVGRTATGEAVRTLDAAGAVLDEIVVPEGRAPPVRIELHLIPLTDVFAAACPGAPPAQP